MTTNTLLRRFAAAGACTLWLACQLEGDIETDSDDMPDTSELLEVDLVLDDQSYPVVVEHVEDTYLLEGDMIVGPTLIPALRDEDSDVQLSYSVTRDDLLWPNGKVPYVIASSLPEKWRVYQAMAHWESRTAIRFVPRTNQRDYVVFQPGSGCWAHLGRIGGRQIVNLAWFCNLGLTIHEIGHTVGLFHEHTRSDRDAHVRVLWENVPADVASNFRTHGAGGNAGAYDFASIMHYGSYELSRNGRPTLLRRPNDGYIAHPQDKTRLSNGDARGVARRYGEPICPLGDGTYCGGNGVGGNANSLYACAGSTLTRLKTCAAGCYHAPAGEPDRCNDCPLGDGLYCGGTSGVGGATGSLYRCAHGALTRVSVCADGCYVAPPGQNDSCR